MCWSFIRFTSSRCRRRSAQHPVSARSPRSGDHLPLPPRFRSQAAATASPLDDLPIRDTALLREGTERHKRTSARSGRCLPCISGTSSFNAGPGSFGPAAEGAARYRPVPAAAPGARLERCDRCSYELSLRFVPQRHCPKCQSSARDRWFLKQARSLLPVPYAHVVFTVPEQLAPLAFRNQGSSIACCSGQLRRRCSR